MAYKKYNFACEICSKDSIVLITENESSPEYCPHCGAFMLEEDDSQDDCESELE